MSDRADDPAPGADGILVMGPADVPALVAIAALSFPTPWTGEDFLTEGALPHAHIDVLRSGGKVVAFCDYWIVGDGLDVINVATHPDWRRRGCGRQLVTHMLGRARALGCHRAALEVRRSNEPAQLLYRNLGFKSVGVRPRYYADNDEDALVMTLEFGS